MSSTIQPLFASNSSNSASKRPSSPVSVPAKGLDDFEDVGVYQQDMMTQFTILVSPAALIKRTATHGGPVITTTIQQILAVVIFLVLLNIFIPQTQGASALLQ